MKEKKILVIMEKDVKPGFQLAGVEVWSAVDLTDAKKLIERAMEDGKYGIIILEESFLEGFDQKTKNEIIDSVIPLVVPINIKKTKEIEAIKYIGEIVRRAIGFQIRIKG